MITTKINIKPHLAEYFDKRYGVENETYIRIPDSLDLYHDMWDYMSKPPADYMPFGNLEIALPHKDHGKQPEFYNHISQRAQRAMEVKMEAMFKRDFHTFVDNYLKSDCFGDDKVPAYISNAVYAFVAKYELTQITEDALIKDEYRHRKRIAGSERRKRNYLKKSVRN